MDTTNIEFKKKKSPLVSPSHEVENSFIDNDDELWNIQLCLVSS